MCACTLTQKMKIDTPTGKDLGSLSEVGSEVNLWEEEARVSQVGKGCASVQMAAVEGVVSEAIQQTKLQNTQNMLAV